jgi:hypothetical protein
MRNEVMQQSLKPTTQAPQVLTDLIWQIIKDSNRDANAWYCSELMRMVDRRAGNQTI